MQKDEKIKEVFHRIMNADLDKNLEVRLERSLEQFRRNLPAHPAFTEANRPQNGFSWFSGWRLAWAASGAFLLVIAFTFLLMANSTPTWAKVARQFQSIPFCYATVFLKSHPMGQTTQFELWMGTGGKLRIRYNTQIIFADKEGHRAAYDVALRRSAAIEPFMDRVIDDLKISDHFSLEVVIESLAGDISKLTPEPVNVDVVSSELCAFTLTEKEDAAWIRIWTLRESLLPIFLRKINPVSGESCEIVFTYQKQQPDEFFDQHKFSQKLQDPSINSTELLYVFFEDQSDFPITSTIREE
jgi:hypothetical protein